jgi:hypothetical protein
VFRLPLEQADDDFERWVPEQPLRCTLLQPRGAVCSVLTGLLLLARTGRIQLDVQLLPERPPLVHGPWHLRDKHLAQSTLVVEGIGTAAIDLHDSWEIDADALARCDVYFKRSLTVSTAPGRPPSPKLRALGLITDVRTEGYDLRELRVELSGARSARERARRLLRWSALTAAARMFDAGSRPTISRMECPPQRGQPPRVLLMAGLWDPAEVPTWAAGKRDEWEAINRMRVGCIRALREAFGERFHGGVRPTPFSLRHCPDIVLSSPPRGSQREFIRRVREHPVCVTSVGLHGSNGFRLAEFVAMSRAIVSEPLCYDVPGDFAAGRNYLPFRTPEECVAQVARLLESTDEREAMMRTNWDYYGRWQRPDRMALRIVALTCAAAQRPAAPLQRDRPGRGFTAQDAPLPDARQ